MRYRLHTTKPTAVLWTLIAGADAAILVAGAGITTLVVLVGLVAVSGAVVLVWRSGRRRVAAGAGVVPVRRGSPSPAGPGLHIAPLAAGRQGRAARHRQA